MAKERIDESTGEVKHEPEFVKMYIKDLCAVKGVTALQTKIFYFMLQNMNYENEVAYGPTAKSRFLSEHETTNASFNNSVKGLLESGLIGKLSRGEFIVNKKYAVKVPWHKVDSIVWKTTYSKRGKKEVVEFEESES